MYIKYIYCTVNGSHGTQTKHSIEIMITEKLSIADGSRDIPSLKILYKWTADSNFNLAI